MDIAIAVVVADAADVPVAIIITTDVAVEDTAAVPISIFVLNSFLGSAWISGTLACRFVSTSSW